MFIKKKNKSILTPQQNKFKKQRKDVLTAFERKNTATNLSYGSYGLKILKSGWLRLKQIETLRKLILRFIKKHETLWIRALPNFPVTRKPKEIRMGKGKGAVEYWVIRLKSGHILFELSHIRFKKAQKILTYISKKLSLPCALVLNTKKVQKMIRKINISTVL